MVFVESPWFSRWRADQLDEEAFRAFQNALQEAPDAGALIPGGHGLRKVRLALPGRGKSGGARVIYYWWHAESRIYLLYAYAKNRQADLTQKQLAQLSALMKEEFNNG